MLAASEFSISTRRRWLALHIQADELTDVFGGGSLSTRSTRSGWCGGVGQPPGCCQAGQLTTRFTRADIVFLRVGAAS